MARCTMKMPEEFLLKISRLGDKTDDVCGRVLNAGAEVVLKKVRTNLRNVISKDTKTQSRSTGELERSLGVSPCFVGQERQFEYQNRLFRAENKWRE